MGSWVSGDQMFELEQKNKKKFTWLQKNFMGDKGDDGTKNLVEVLIRCVWQLDVGITYT